jgi:hypothetical protein
MKNILKQSENESSKKAIALTTPYFIIAQVATVGITHPTSSFIIQNSNDFSRIFDV